MLFSKVLPYELKITVKSSDIHGGGLPNDSFVEVSIDGTLLETTESAPPPSEWNKLIIKKFSEIDPLTPIIVSFSVYKKRWTSQGFKLVGTVSFPLSELYNIINKGPTDRVLELISNRRNVTLSGTLSVTLEMVQEDKRRQSLAGMLMSNKDPVATAITTSTTTTETITTVKTNSGPSTASKLIKQIFEFENYHFGITTLAWLVIITALFSFYQYNSLSQASTKLQNIDALIDRLENKLREYAEMQK